MDEALVAPAAYAAECDACQSTHTLPRSHAAIRASIRLQRALEATGDSLTGIRFGVLVGVDCAGRTGTLWAHSDRTVPPNIDAPWVPEADLTDSELVQEYETLNALRALEAELQAATSQLADLDARIAALQSQYEPALQGAQAARRTGHLERQAVRRMGQLTPEDDETLRAQSRQENGDLRRIKRTLNAALTPLRKERADTDGFRASLRRQRRTLTRDLYAHGKTYGPPGDAKGTEYTSLANPCCAPKLLQYASRHSIRPLGMAEFQCDEGSLDGQRPTWRYVGPCLSHCQPLLPALLCWTQDDRHQQLPDLTETPLEVVYEDHALWVVDKPAGLPSVPGRMWRTSDNVIARLAHVDPNGPPPLIVHRLDVDTSGLMLIAKTPEVQADLAQQFQARTVEKRYHARLTRSPATIEGVITLRLSRDRANPPKQCVVQTGGRDAVTEYRVLSHDGQYPLVELRPLTGRTHQLRVHAAAETGLNAPIVGDPLYGEDRKASRMELHASELEFIHPLTRVPVRFRSKAPFLKETPR